MQPTADCDMKGVDTSGNDMKKAKTNLKGAFPTLSQPRLAYSWFLRQQIFDERAEIGFHNKGNYV